jgi:hypothetical protein
MHSCRSARWCTLFARGSSHSLTRATKRRAGMSCLWYRTHSSTTGPQSSANGSTSRAKVRNLSQSMGMECVQCTVSCANQRVRARANPHTQGVEVKVEVLSTATCPTKDARISRLRTWEAKTRYLSMCVCVCARARRARCVSPPAVYLPDLNHRRTAVTAERVRLHCSQSCFILRIMSDCGGCFFLGGCVLEDIFVLEDALRLRNPLCVRCCVCLCVSLCVSVCLCVPFSVIAESSSWAIRCLKSWTPRSSRSGRTS